MTRRYQLFLCLVLIGGSRTVAGTEPISFVSKANNEQERIAELLDVTQILVECEARRPFRYARLTIDCFRDGKKVMTTSGGVVPLSPQKTVTVSVQIADLDKISLDPAKPGHLRIWHSLRAGDGSTMAGPLDLPKSAFDLTNCNGAASLHDSTGMADGATAIYYAMRVINHTVTGRDSLKGLIKSNPGADILIVSVLLTEGEE